MKSSWELVIVLLFSWHVFTNAQNISIDSLAPFGRFVMQIAVMLLGPSSENSEDLQMARALDKLQPRVRDDVHFPCPSSNTRSKQRPTNVHSLRPGDIDVIGAIGDSLTTGQGALSTNAFQALTQSRGTAFTAGGEGTWRQYITLPNILKAFNPNIIGYSLGDSFLTDEKSQFNIAEAGVKSSDLMLLAQELIMRIKNDTRINIDTDWKLITIFIGTFDFCMDVCYQKTPEIIIENHRKELTEALRTLRNQLPKTIVNVISSLHLKVMRDVTRKNMPSICNFTYNLFCPCIFGPQFQKHQPKYDQIMTKWRQMQPEVVNLPEFDTDDFTVVLQPFTINFAIPKTKEGFTDYSYLTSECAHLSQKQEAIAATSLWNNMLEPVGRKSTALSKVFDFKCPSAEHPYIFTRRNSINK